MIILIKDNFTRPLWPEQDTPERAGDPAKSVARKKKPSALDALPQLPCSVASAASAVDVRLSFVLTSCVSLGLTQSASQLEQWPYNDRCSWQMLNTSSNHVHIRYTKVTRKSSCTRKLYVIIAWQSGFKASVSRNNVIRPRFGQSLCEEFARLAETRLAQNTRTNIKTTSITLTQLTVQCMLIQLKVVECSLRQFDIC